MIGTWYTYFNIGLIEMLMAKLDNLVQMIFEIRTLRVSNTIVKVLYYCQQILYVLIHCLTFN